MLPNAVNSEHMQPELHGNPFVRERCSVLVTHKHEQCVYMAAMAIQ